MMAPHQTVILKNPPIILLSIQTRPTDQALNHAIAKFRINRRKSIPYKIYVAMWTIGAGAMDRSADFVQLLSQFVQQTEGGMDSGLRTWANQTIRERLEAVEKDLPGPLEEIEIYLRSEGVDRTSAKKTSAV
jgi:hypothetical protein